MNPRFTVDGPAVRALRMTLGLEIADVASRVGITASYLSRVECNSLRMKARTFIALCDALNSDNPADLLLRTQEEDDRRRGHDHARIGP